jgi:methyl coenzyme M reductase subunit C
MATRREVDIPDVVDKGIRAIVKKLNAPETKGTIADLIKLLQLREEVAVKPTQTIRAMWVNECDIPTTDR